MAIFVLSNLGAAIIELMASVLPDVLEGFFADHKRPWKGIILILISIAIIFAIIWYCQE